MNSQFTTQTADSVENALDAYLDDCSPAAIAMKQATLIEALTDSRERIERAIAAAEGGDTSGVWSAILCDAPFNHLGADARRYMSAVRAAKREAA